MGDEDFFRDTRAPARGEKIQPDITMHAVRGMVQDDTTN
jgi:hypothetical protein